jgi:hypothetical protein
MYGRASSIFGRASPSPLQRLEIDYLASQRLEIDYQAWQSRQADLISKTLHEWSVGMPSHFCAGDRGQPHPTAAVAA